MKFKITEQKKNNTVTLNVKLTKSEIKSESTVNYGWRSAKEKLKQEGYNLGKMLEYTTLMNKFAVYEGDFIFVVEPVLSETITSEIKVVVPPTLKVDKKETVPTLKEEVKSPPRPTTKSTRRTSRKKK
jgi:hypothetical protein